MKATIIRLAKSKFGLTTMLFLLFIGFIDSYSIYRQLRMNKEINELEQNKKEYQDQIVEFRKKIQTIEEDKDRVAREKYLYKKPDEDLLIIKE